MVELLVSLLLGLLLSAGMVSAYLGAKRDYFLDEQYARMQENSRYAMRLLSRELALAGFHAGLPHSALPPPVTVGTDCSDQPWALDGSNALDMVHDHQGNAAPVSVALVRFTCLDGRTIIPGSDLIAIKRTAAAPSLREGVLAEMLTSSSVEKWYLRTRSGGPASWERLASRDLRDLGRADPTSSYWEAAVRIFFVRQYSETRGDGIPTLCMETLAGNAMTVRCLVEGVEDLQLEFGVDSDGDGVPERYVAAPNAAQLERAVTVKVHLLLRSLTTVAGHRDAWTHRLGDKLLPARNDAYLRQVASFTVVLRNHRGRVT